MVNLIYAGSYGLFTQKVLLHNKNYVATDHVQAQDLFSRFFTEKSGAIAVRKRGETPHREFYRLYDVFRRSVPCQKNLYLDFSITGWWYHNDRP